MTDIKIDFPARYYVSYDKAAPQPARIAAWYDVWATSTTDGIPPASDMIAVTEEQWNDPTFHAPTGKGVKDGAIIDYTPAPTPIPLKTQAQSEMMWVQQQASMVSAMGEEFSDRMKAYVKALQAIITGTDTTSTVLPVRPS